MWHRRPDGINPQMHTGSNPTPHTHPYRGTQMLSIVPYTAVTYNAGRENVQTAPMFPSPAKSPIAPSSSQQVLNRSILYALPACPGVYTDQSYTPQAPPRSTRVPGDEQHTGGHAEGEGRKRYACGGGCRYCACDCIHACTSGVTHTYTLIWSFSS